MKLFKPYSNIKDFLHRFTILKIGKLHIRIHKITSEDKTSLFHNHPFHYISIILRGGYTEMILDNDVLSQRRYTAGDLILRSNKTYHRIDKLHGETITLFIAYGKYAWNAINPVISDSDDGIFERIINEKRLWNKRKNGIWYIGNVNKDVAERETRHSIHQVENGQ
jgi:hypothetical protein